MGFFSRFSRQATSEAAGNGDDNNNDSDANNNRSSSPNTGSGGSDPVQYAESPAPIPPASSPSPARTFSKDSEGYPSWLPKRPPPPAPASTIQSSVAGPPPFTPSPHATVPMPSAIHYSHSSSSGGAVPIVERQEPLSPGPAGRRQTPRSVRIVSLQEGYGYNDSSSRREPTDQTRVPSGSYYGPGRSRQPVATPTLLASARASQPRFRARGLHLQLLHNPTLLSHIHFWLFRILVFAHVPIQTFFDFNAVFVFVQASKFPTLSAGPGSSRNWALGAAAYVVCWFIWIVGVCIIYDLVYSFARRWRMKRPSIFPLYMSSPAHNLVLVSSYRYFCFFQHIRLSAFHASLREGLAETFYFFSQNWPTVGLLLPRGALALAALFAFASPNGSSAARDSTFFRADGSLTSYAFGVLTANAAWVAWRALVLIFSTLGLWAVSGHGCAGICGPRFRWEEEDMFERKNRRSSMYSDDFAQDEKDELPWDWRECTRERVSDAFEFCLSQKRRSMHALEKQEAENILAAISGRRDERRGVKDIFHLEDDRVVERTDTPPELAAIIPRVVAEERERERRGKARETSEGPMLDLPYPFTAPGAAYSSDDQVPFPPSPHTGEEDEDEEEDEEGEGDDERHMAESEDPSSNEPRTSGSMSSLGQPVSSLYPFQFRRPTRTTGTGTMSSSSMMSHSRVSQSTGNVESSESPSNHSPPSRINYSTRSRGSRASHGTRASSHNTSSSDPQYIPYPPRHPRARSGTVPVPTRSVGSSDPSSSPPPSILFPRSTSRMDQDITEAFGSSHQHRGRRAQSPGTEAGDNSFGTHMTGEEIEERPDEEEVDGEEGEHGDRVGLLSFSEHGSAGPSPRPSLTGLNIRRRSSTMSRSHHSSSGRSSGSPRSRTHSHTGSSSGRSRTGSLSVPPSVRSRAQSLMQNIGAASRSSLELVRSRTNSLARLEESLSEGYHSRTSSSDANMSGQEGHTFGYPSRFGMGPGQPPAHDIDRVEEESERANSEDNSRPGSQRSQGSSNARSRPGAQTVFAPPPAAEETTSHRTQHVRDETDRTVTGVPIPSSSSPYEGPIPDVVLREEQEPEQASSLSHSASQPDVSTANPSFVTSSATIEGSTTDSGHSFGTVSHIHPAGRAPGASEGVWAPQPPK